MRNTAKRLHKSVKKQRERCQITQKCNDIIWKYKYICNRNNQVNKIIKQTKLYKGKQCLKL